MSITKAQEKIKEQAQRIRELEAIEEDYMRLQRENERMKAEIALLRQSQGPHQVDIYFVVDLHVE